MGRTDSLEKTLKLGKIEGGRRRGWQRMRCLDGITARWTWVWVNSGSWWWTGRPGMLQSMGSQRVGHDRVTELNWAEQLVQSSLLLIIAIKIEKLSFIWKILNWDFPDDPVVKTQKVNFHCSKAQVQTMVGELTVTCCMLWAKKSTGLLTYYVTGLVT